MEKNTIPAVVMPPASLKPTEIEHWRVLLAEFTHLLGLLLIHSRHATNVRATSVLFDQMLRHLKVLEKMPGHEGDLIMSCHPAHEGAATHEADYCIRFGSMMLQRKSQEKDGSPIGGKHASYLNRALDQTFGYLLGYGIESLNLKLPGEMEEKIDQLRLALNIISRFQDAVENKGSVTFHYGDRALAIPLIANPQGKPDFNLTVLAGVNGLSAANAVELIKQAKAFHDMALAAPKDDQQQYNVINDSYDQIFKVRSLRAQIVRPLVEVNNIAQDSSQGIQGDNGGGQCVPNEIAEVHDGSDTIRYEKEDKLTEAVYNRPAEDYLLEAAATRQYLSGYLDDDDSQAENDLGAVVVEDYTALDTQTLGERLVATSRLLYHIDRKSQDPAVGNRLLYYLQVQMLHVRGEVLAQIEVQRQGLRFSYQGRMVMVGLVHPRLVDMVTMVKDQVITQYKILVIQKIAFDFDFQFTELVAKGFDISASKARIVLDLLKTCFDNRGTFHRDAFESRIDEMAQHANTFFEVNWCFLNETPLGKDRLALLNAIQLLMVRLEDPKRALRFLLDDLCQAPAQINYADRNAFVLSNILLQAENKTLHVDLEHTSESILKSVHEVDKEVHRYAIWRINTDQVRLVEKLETLHHALEHALKLSADEKSAPVDFLLALQREAILFLTLVNGPTARQVICRSLERYGNPQAPIYNYASECDRLLDLLAQLHIVVRCMGYVGYMENISLLQAVPDNINAWLELDAHPVYALKVNTAMETVAKAIKMIQEKAF